jgi:hypothetical protein
MFPRVARRPRTCVALTAAVALLAVAGAVPASAAGPFEPNDNIGQAYGPLTGGADYSAALETRSDRDYYIFYAAGQAQLDIAFSVGLVGCPTLTLADRNNGQVLGFVRPGAGTTAHIRYSSPPGGSRFFLTVETDACADPGKAAPYTVRIDPGNGVTGGASIPPPTATSEPNDSAGQAWGPLTARTMYGASLDASSDTQDWFAFYANPDQQFDAQLWATGTGCETLTITTTGTDGSTTTVGDMGGDIQAISHITATAGPGGGTYWMDIHAFYCTDSYEFVVDSPQPLPSSPPTHPAPAPAPARGPATAPVPAQAKTVDEAACRSARTVESHARSVLVRARRSRDRARSARARRARARVVNRRFAAWKRARATRRVKCTPH